MKGSDLVGVPYKNGSFCRKKEGKLIVLVKNQGDADADSTTHTKVSWGPGGVYGWKEAKTKKLKKGEEEFLEFECPKNCFSPDCEFYITVDWRKELNNEKKGVVGVDQDAYDNTWNNIKKGICLERDKPFLPDLVPEQYNTKAYFKRDGNVLKVTIRNQGSAIAGASKTEVKFQDGTIETRDIPELEPGEPYEFSVPIPEKHHAGNFRLKISVDVENKICESSKDNNQQEDRYIEAEQPL